MKEKDTINRDELASLMGISPRRVQELEKRLGLTICRIKLQTRPQLYIRKQALSILKSLNYPV